MDIPYRKTKDGIIIQVRVQPRSSNREIVVEGDRLKVKLRSAPIDNKANEELIDLIAEELGYKKSLISIKKGLSSREKVLLIRVSS